jgi:hypothetical protein
LGQDLEEDLAKERDKWHDLSGRHIDLLCKVTELEKVIEAQVGDLRKFGKALEALERKVEGP